MAVDRLLSQENGTDKWATTQFVYQGHNCVQIVDPRGVSAIVNEYDPDTGRLVKHTDADGKSITYDHQVDTRREVVTDRNGAAVQPLVHTRDSRPRWPVNEK